MRYLLIWLIRFYQHCLSPRKGYACALRTVRGRGSGCSGVGLRLLRRHGVWHGLRLLRQRLHRCTQAAQTLRHAASRPPRPLRTQRGSCDCSPASCELDGSDLRDCRSVANCLSDVPDFPSCSESRRTRRHGGRRGFLSSPWLWMLCLALVLCAVHRWALPAPQWWAWLSGLLH